MDRGSGFGTIWVEISELWVSLVYVLESSTLWPMGKNKTGGGAKKNETVLKRGPQNEGLLLSLLIYVFNSALPDTQPLSPRHNTVQHCFMSLNLWFVSESIYKVLNSKLSFSDSKVRSILASYPVIFVTQTRAS